MHPRLKSSKKWTNFPQEYLDQIKEVFMQTFEEQLKPKNSAEATISTNTTSLNGEFRVDGRIYPEEILLRVGYLEKGRLTQANFETSIDFNPNKQNAVESIHKCVDAIASMMLEYFQSQEKLEIDLDFPITWTSYKFEGQEIFFNYNTINTNLEEEADRLLGIIEKRLFHETEEIEFEEEAETLNFEDEVQDKNENENKSSDKKPVKKTEH